MVDGVASEILCGICDEVCKRGTRVKCCGAKACRACAVLKISKDWKCWDEDCGKKISKDHLFNDMDLRKAIEHFNKNGKLTEAMEKRLAADTEKFQGRRDRTWTTVAEKFNQPCFKGRKCKLKGKACLFNHDNDEEPKPKTTPKSKKAKAGTPKGKKGNPAKKQTPAKNGDKAAAKVNKESEDKALCKFGTNCTRPQCKFAHPGKVNKPCNFGSSCMKTDCKFQHDNEVLRRKLAKMSKLSSGSLGPMMNRPMAMGGSMGSMMGGLGGSDMMGYLEMEKMKSKLENMMQSFMSKNRGYGGRMGGGFRL